ncbi:VQ motif-containing protein 11-like [Cucurbita moschata]|uniref:VQ motif-containing protein 11-like n=1 Tax=Cucurbita moschata TaxID=3662 RepID=A0A6J1H8B6_CUCMO|nr:VQ motif-containing protein 11-like [Cucurbita moschata]
MAATATAATVHSSTTTFVEADPSSFRAIVQKLTGAPNAPSASFRLQERRRSSKKLELELNGGDGLTGIGIGIEMVSPVSTLDFVARGNPCEEEEKAIAGKGFYLHPSPISPPGGSQPPRLLPLFPLSSPRDCNFRNHSVSS